MEESGAWMFNVDGNVSIELKLYQINILLQYGDYNILRIIISNVTFAGIEIMCRNPGIILASIFVR